MKPLSVTMQAFGPYPGRQPLDFRLLGGNTLFLIHGPTGGGKTTILDAMCYALYGSTSGNDREGKQMRSDYADPALPTEVVFDFALGAEEYRIIRRPEQDRPKRRGEGMVTDPAQATLWRRTGCAEGDEGSVLESQASRVTAYVEDLLGFDVNQFRQVVLLPQGKFRELLLAPSREREAILASLFQTEQYEAITQRLKDATKALEEELKGYRERRAFVLQSAGVDTPAALQEQQEALAADLAAMDPTLQALRAASQQAANSLQAGALQAEKVREREEAQAALVAVLAREPEADGLRHRLAAARRAEPLATAERALAQRRREADTAQRDVQDAEAGLTAAAGTLAHADQAHATALTREPEREAARQALVRLRDLQDKVGRLAESRRQLAAAEEALAHRQADRETAHAGLQEVENGLAALREQRADAQQRAAQLAAADLGLHEARRVLDARQEYDRISAALAQARTKHAWMTEQTCTAEGRYQHARAEAERLQQAWDAGQAAILARGLTPETPCPVCGSRHHPEPAAAQADLPTEEAVKQAFAHRAVCEQERDAARQTEAAQAQVVAGLESEARAKGAALGAQADESAEALAARVRQAEAVLVDAERAAGEITALQADIDGAEQREGALRAALEGADAAVQQAMREQANAAAVAAEREQEIPGELREPDALRRALTEAEAHARQLEEAWQQVQDALQRAREAQAAWAARQQAARETATTALERAQQQEREFLASLQAAGFTASGDFAAAQADIPEIAALEQEVGAFERAKEAAADRVLRADQAAAGLTMPDLGALEHVAQEAAAALEEGLRRQQALTGALAQAEERLRALREIEQQAAQREERHKVMSRLAEVAAGCNAHNLTFQRFVLATLLDDVLLVASKRLHLMSKGRFALQRIGTRTDGRRASGLDLEVADTYTGTARPVATLSGGESFLASLALALGLADVVQSYAGGLRLETMFVDEGFGSLDPESLDLALRALIDLQPGGRLVGIISHVPELRERIDVRLEVTAGQRGSTARFVVS